METTNETSTRRPRRRQLGVLLTLLGALALMATACDSPSTPAAKLFDAWKANNKTLAAATAEPAAVTQIFAKPYAGTSGWFFNKCEGAAGSTYCTWIDNTEGRLEMRITNSTNKVSSVQRIGLGSIDAGRFFHAWRANKKPSAVPYGTTAAVNAMFSVAYTSAAHWTPTGCEGAAGSTYCTWNNDHADTIVLRLDNATNKVTSVTRTPAP